MNEINGTCASAFTGQTTSVRTFLYHWTIKLVKYKTPKTQNNFTWSSCCWTVPLSSNGSSTLSLQTIKTARTCKLKVLRKTFNILVKIDVLVDQNVSNCNQYHLTQLFMQGRLWMPIIHSTNVGLCIGTTNIILRLQAYAWAWVPCAPHQYYWYIIQVRTQVMKITNQITSRLKITASWTSFRPITCAQGPHCTHDTFCQKELEITENIENITAISYWPYDRLNRSQPWCNISFGDLKKTRLLWQSSMHTLILSKLCKKNKQTN